MANNYYDATGVLILKQATPVIHALFGGFNLDESYPGRGRAYIASISEGGTNSSWKDIFQRLSELAESLSIQISDGENSNESVLESLAVHFKCDNNEDFCSLIEHHNFEDSADLDALFLIATQFNDGHELTAIQMEGAWYCSKPRLGEFGGVGTYICEEFVVSRDSGFAAAYGTALHEALLEKDFQKAASCIEKEISSLLAGFSDATVSSELRVRLIGLLQEKV